MEENMSERLISALEPFAALLNRRWTDKRKSIATGGGGGHVSELHAISLADVLNAADALSEIAGRKAWQRKKLRRYAGSIFL